MTKARPITGVVAVAAGIAFSLASVAGATAKPAALQPVTAPSFTLDAGTAGPARESATWSGYVVTPRTPLTNVSARWKVPPVSCRPAMSPQAAVFWVGLDGWYERTVEQAGVEAFCSGTTAVYTAWWEMFPSTHITQVYSVRPGDEISASVSYGKGIFTIVVKDLSLRRISSITARCPSSMICRRSSAEWIAESPTYGAQDAYLPPWSPLTFSGAQSSATVNQRSSRISGFIDFPVVMSGLHGRQARAGPLLGEGSGFTEYWLASN